MRKNGHIKIEKGIPLRGVVLAGHRPSPFTEALSKLKVMESFWIKRSPGKAARAAYMWRLRGDRENVRFAVRKEKDGVRVWRVK